MRRSFAALATAACLLAVMCGAAFAWADPAYVVSNVNAYGLTATVSGTTVTISGEKQNATNVLNLGDISGLTIDWKATLTYSPDTPDFVAEDGPVSRVIEAGGNGGVFKMTGGKIEVLPSAPRTADHFVWIFFGHDVEKVSLLGGEIIGEHVHDRGFDVALEGESNRWKLEIDGATIKMVSTINGGRIDFIKGDTSKIQGAVAYGDDTKGYTMELFGKISFGDEIKKAKDRDMTATVLVNNGAKIAFQGVDFTGAKIKLNFDVDGEIDFTGLKAKIEKLTVNPGGVAVLDENCDVEVVNGEVKSKAASSSASVSAQATAHPNYGILEVNGKLTVPAGGSLTVENVNGLVLGSASGANISLSGGTLHLPKDMTDEQIRELGLDPTDSKIKRDSGTDGDPISSSSGGACATGAAAVIGLAAIAAMKMRKK